MPDIMVRCPTVGTAVPTGLTTEAVKFGIHSGHRDTISLSRLSKDAPMAADHHLGR